MTLAEARDWFPSLQQPFVFLENAGGSQVPRTVAEAIREYMLTDYVQLGAGYPQSVRATETVERAHDFAAELVNAGSAGRVVLGPSTTALIHLIAAAYGEIWQPCDEVVVATSNHEANIGPWVRLERFGIRVRFWNLDRETLADDYEALESMLGGRTRLVAVPHVSNLIGAVADIPRITQLAHAVGAKVCVDGVAFAPHRAVDVQALGVDWYVYSHYKVYGPHLATLFGTHAAWSELKGPNHFFIPDDSVPYKWELGGVSHEACAGLLGVQPYLLAVSGDTTWEGPATIARAFSTMATWESDAEHKIRSALDASPRLRVLAPAGSERVGTFSFLHTELPSDEVARRVHRHGIGIRNGHMYAYRLCEWLGIPPDPGVVRVSMVHTNTVEEIDRLIEAMTVEGIL